jgi:hypothetical protein
MTDDGTLFARPGVAARVPAPPPASIGTMTTTDLRVAGGSLARPVLHVMLYGNVTGRRAGWARPAELDALLDPVPGPWFAVPAPPGPDLWLWPAADNFWFWDAWYSRRGEGEWREFGEQWITAGLPLPGQLEPEITFYLGTHRPSWLWSGKADFPLCVSYGTLREVKNLRRGLVPWILDSRGFSELSENGRWTITPAEYVEFTVRCDEEIGGLQWASPQDHMCEDGIIYGGMSGNVRCAGTRQFIDPAGRMTRDELITEHQRLTTVNFQELTGLWPRHSARPCPYIPVLQGDRPEAYLRHYRMYLAAGVELGEEHPVVGVGSVCRLQSTGQIGAVARALNGLNLDLHWFGLKLTGLQRPEIQRPAGDRFSWGGTQSMDSASWSIDARYEPRHPACTHVSPKTGLPQKCNNCSNYAGWWRERVLASMAAAQASPGRSLVQGTFFDENWEDG